MEYEISCGMLLIHEETKKILILKVENELEWGLPQGHVDCNEKELDTAFREVYEEVSIDRENISLVYSSANDPLSIQYEYKSPVSGNIRRIIFFCGTTNREPKLSDEHCGYAWCTLKEGLKYLHFEDIQDCVKKLYSGYLAEKKSV